MYTKKMRFSLVSLMLCLGFISGVSAAPTVRVLGGNAANSTAKAAYIPVSSGAKNTSTTGSVTKKATVSKLSISPNAASQASIRQTAKMPTASDSGTVKTANTERFPTVSSFGVAPTSYKVSTSNTTVALQGVNEKIENLSMDIADLQDKLAGEYMTSEEISSNYYDSNEIDIFKEGIYVQINNLKDEMDNIQIEEVDTIYDYATQSRKHEAIVNDFDPSIFDNNGLND